VPQDTTGLVIAGIVLAAVFVVVLNVLYYARRVRRAESLLQTWANENSFRVVARRRLWKVASLLCTPLPWPALYRVTAEDAQGRTRNCVVRFGSFSAGLKAGQVEVRWLF